MDYPLEKLFECCFLIGFNKVSYILGNWAFLRIRRNIIGKVKEKTLVIKGKGKGNGWKKHNLRKQLATIVYPQTNHSIVYQGCSWTSFWKIVLMFSLNKISYIYIYSYIIIYYLLYIIIIYIWEIEHFSAKHFQQSLMFWFWACMCAQQHPELSSDYSYQPTSTWSSWDCEWNQVFVFVSKFFLLTQVFPMKHKLSIN